MNFTYRNASYRERPFGGGRLIRRVEAMLGNMSAQGANKTEAKKALEEVIERQLTHGRTRRYLSANGITFALFYSNGWGYDIIKAPELRGYNQGGSVLFGGEEHEDECKAFEAMKRHFEQYAIEGVEVERGLDRTNGELDAAILAYREDDSYENMKRLQAAQQAHVDAFYAEQAEEFQARTSA